MPGQAELRRTDGSTGTGRLASWVRFRIARGRETSPDVTTTTSTKPIGKGGLRLRPSPRRRGLLAGSLRAFHRHPPLVLRLFQLLEALRPVAPEEAREGAVGEKAAAGLAGGAVVRLVLRVNDPLDVGTARGAGLPVLPVDGHLLAEGGDLLRERIARLAPEAIGPLDEGLLRRLVESRDLLVRELPRQGDGESRARWRISSE